MILAGDVGGTKTNLGLFEREGHGLRLVRSDKFHSPDFPGLSAVIHAFLSDGPVTLEAACFGIPGPVIENRASTPNLAWVVDGALIASDVQVRSVALINDLVATAEGIPLLGAEELATLQEGSPDPVGNRVLIAAGTGLGEALIVRDGERRVVIPSEGGHGDLAARNELEDDLLRYLRKEFGRVSYERVLSGAGLFNVYRFLRDTGWAKESPAVAARMQKENPSAIVSELGLAKGDALCDKALDVFVSVYGAEAGNLALKAMAVGGVLVSGGIAPRIIERMAAGGFVAAFRDKGRLASLMDSLPIHVSLNPRAPLFGAAHVASGMV